MIAEEAVADEVAMEYFLTPETPSSSHLALVQTETEQQAHSKKDGDHGYVNSSAVKRSE